MADWAQFGITVLGEFGAGNGEVHDELTRFGLGGIFWLGLLLLRWGRGLPKAEEREQLLVPGFLVGLAREVLMFWVYALEMQGTLRAADLEPYFPPLEHALLLASVVMIAGAFLRYLLPAGRTAYRYLAGAGALALGAYLVTAPWWWRASQRDAALRFGQVWCDWVFHGLGAVALLGAIWLLLRRGRTRLRFLVALVLGLWLLDDTLMLWSLHMDLAYQIMIDPIRHNLHLWAIPLLGLVYFRESQAVAGRALARAEASRGALEESFVRERAEFLQRETLQAELLQAQKLEAIGQLAGGVAHDFNNVLTAMGGYAELALTTLAADAEARADIEGVLTSVQRAARLTRQLLLFSRRERVQREMVSLPALVEGLRSMLVRLLDERCRLVVDAGQAPCVVCADRGQLEQVLLNLVVNARDAMPEGGEIRIRTWAQPDAQPRSEADRSGWACLEVTDQGEGMREEVRARIFDPFFTTKKQGKGSGLGLAVVHGIAQDHGGRIEVTSRPGEGARFRVLLPRVAEGVPAEVAEEEVTRRVARRLRGCVLLVEDEVAVRAVTRRLLKEQGFCVAEAGTVAEALRLWRERVPRLRLVVSDLVLPDGTGLDLVRVLHRGAPGLPIVVMTGHVAGALAREADEIADAFLRKPFDRDALRAAVETATQSSRLPALEPALEAPSDPTLACGGACQPEPEPEPEISAPASETARRSA